MALHITKKQPLKDFTTFRIGGDARFFCIAATVNELEEAVAFARERSVPIFVLGGGSNILVSDQGFNGLMIKMEMLGMTLEHLEENNIQKFGDTYMRLVASAGVLWDDVVAFAAEHGLAGIENLSLIPGSAGAAPVQNIGAYGSEIKDALEYVDALNTETGNIERIKNEDCHFSYRDSIFKKPEGKKYIITGIALILDKNGALNTAYADINRYITEHTVSREALTPKMIREIVIAIRQAKLPDVRTVGTAGSFFKNPIISREEYAKLEKKYPGISSFPAENGRVKISAAWLLDKVCGFKGYREGEVGTYKNQALVLVNHGEARASDVHAFAKKMTDAVREKTEIILEREVEYVR